MFHLDLLKRTKIVTINFKENNTLLGLKWANALTKEIQKGIFIPQSDRIYNLNKKWTREKTFKRIKECIKKINNYKHFINYDLNKTILTQEDFNYLHRYFELMRGEAEKPNKFYFDAPPDIKLIIEEFNVLIHRWEDIGSPGRIVIHIKNRDTYDLEDSDYDNWTLDYNPGDIRLNYCHKGKTIWDVYKDHDKVIGENNIRPQYKYSADFNIGFNRGPGVNNNFINWWKINEIFLSNLGFNFNDKKCAIGQAIVGKLIGDPEEIKKNIFGVTKIIGVRKS